MDETRERKPPESFDRQSKGSSLDSVFESIARGVLPYLFARLLLLLLLLLLLVLRLLRLLLLVDGLLRLRLSATTATSTLRHFNAQFAVEVLGLQRLQIGVLRSPPHTHNRT